jgi:hypothetical protein
VAEKQDAASTSRHPVRRLPGLCLYCGRPLYSHRRLACTAHRDLLAVDPLVNRAHLVLSEAERIRVSR